MNKQNKDWIRFGIYGALVILINLVSTTLFFRLDLTRNGIYSLSDASVQAVSTLEEPLTIRIFLSDNLPQPYNTLEQEVRDLMEEYSLKGNRFFNYEIHMIDKQGKATNDRGTLLTSLAANYGIQPIEIQSYQDNQLSLVSVYMGMVILQGDMSQRVNTIGQRGNLEYEFTSLIDQLAEKTNRLIAMEEDIQVKLIFSSALSEIAPDYQSYPQDMSQQVESLQGDFFNRLNFQHIDPDLQGTESIESYSLDTYSIGTEEGERWVYAALVVDNGVEFQAVELVESGLFGSRIREPMELKDAIGEIADRLLGTQQVIAYLSSHGAPGLYDYSQYFGQASQGRFLQSFNQLVSGSYQLQPVTLDELSKGMEILIIAGVTESFSDWELYQLDQFLLSGGSLALFLDPFLEQAPQGQMAYFGGQPSYIPLDTGLNRLLEKHGLTMNSSILLDEQCYKARNQAQGGGFQEMDIYYIPEITQDKINDTLGFMRNLKGLYMFSNAPLTLAEEMPQGISHEILFASSDQAWEMAENISLDPQRMFPPGEDLRKSYPLAVLLEGDFQSIFSSDELPEPPALAEEDGEALVFQSQGTQRNVLSHGSGGRILLVGSSYVLGDNVLDPQGQSPNAQFILNSLDYLADREDYALMRSKGQAYNPVDSLIPAEAKTALKVVNIVGVPLLVVLFGLFMWLRWIKRRNRIAQVFEGDLS